MIVVVKAQSRQPQHLMNKQEPGGGCPTMGQTGCQAFRELALPMSALRLPVRSTVPHCSLGNSLL